MSTTDIINVLYYETINPFSQQHVLFRIYNYALEETVRLTESLVGCWKATDETDETNATGTVLSPF